MNAFHFLRPYWLLALVPLAILLFLSWRRQRSSGRWETLIDSRLLPYVIVPGGDGRSRWMFAAVALGGLLAIVALAGPVWSKLEQPLFRRDSALVLLLDLSRSMDAADLQPSRLQMARFKVRDILAHRQEGTTALAVYAANNFTVTPLTSDVDNIVRQLSSLGTDLMPAQGSRADRALTEAQKLLQQAGAAHGDVLLITDGVDNSPNAALKKAVTALRNAGYRLSVIGVGTSEGAPIPQPGGGFFKDEHGAIVLPKLQESALRALAEAGGGIYRRLAADDSDTEALTKMFDETRLGQPSERMAGLKSDQWREEGPWLLLPLLPLAALAFRRGYLLALFLFMLPLPRPANALEWSDLWRTPNQQGAQAWSAQQHQEAARLFTDPQWRAAAHYRAGDYQSTLNDLKDRHSAVDAYNRGNALAHLGKFPEAVNAFEEALKLDPGFADATHNRDLVKQWIHDQSSQEANRDQKDSNHSPGDQGPQKSDAKQSGTTGAKQSDKRGTDAAQGQSPSTHQESAKGEPNNPTSEPSAGKDSAPQEQGSSSELKEGHDKKETDAKREGQSAPGDTRRSEPQDQATTMKNESDRATEQWLRRIPDDPGGLWRRKFLYQYQRDDQNQGDEEKPW